MLKKITDRLFQKNARSALAAGVMASLLWALVVLTFATPFAALEELSGDWIWRLAASREAERRIVIVDIDEASLQRVGQWPWSRPQLAKLSDRLAGAGVALQIYDLVLPAPATGDDRLFAALQKNNAVLSQIFAIQGNGTVRQGQVSSPLDWPACPAVFPSSEHYIANAPAYAAIPAGHITPLVGADGVIRKQPAVICHEGRPYPALFIAAAKQGANSPQLALSTSQGPWSPAWEIDGVHLGNRPVPLDSVGNVRIPWLVRPESLTAVAAHQVLDGEFPPGLFDNAWVLVGSTALGVNDRVATPFSGLGAGLQVHAQLLIGLIDNRIPAVPRGEYLFTAVIMLAGLALFFIQRRGRPVAGMIIGGLAISGLAFALKAMLLLTLAWWVEWVSGSVFVLLLALILSLFELARSRFERDRIYAHLASYLPGPVAAALAVRDPSDAIDAARRDVIVLYADIRNFSAYCEVRPPEETAAVLHALISAATTIVEGQGGTIQSIQGDGIVAVWGADPGAAEGTPGRHAEAALHAARELLHASRQILPDPDPGHLQSLALGIGLESGPATVGSFGLARRRTHLVMGRAVTIAVRLEEMTIELAHPILVGENLAAYLGQHQLESQGVFLLDGIVSPCHIYAYPLKRCV